MIDDSSRYGEKRVENIAAQIILIVFTCCEYTPKIKGFLVFRFFERKE